MTEPMLPGGLTPIVLDFETAYSPEYSLRKMSITEYIRDPRFQVHGFAYSMPGVSPRWVSGRDAEEALRGFQWNCAAVVGHNLKFDGSILAWKYGIVPTLYVDTLSMSFAVNGATIQSHSLGALATHYGLPQKGVMQTSGIMRELTAAEEAQLAEYCRNDVEITQSVFSRLRTGFPRGQYEMLDWTIRAFTCPQLELDAQELEKAAMEEAARREVFFQKPGFERDKFSSNVKFPALLKEHGFEVPMKKSPRTGKEIPAIAVGDTEFVSMLESEDPKLVELCEARVAAKSTLFETRSAKLARIGRTGSWPFDVVFSGAKQTHRFSGGPGAGGNPQNFPKKDERASVIRRCVKAPAGHKLVVGDFSNIELRVLAWLAQDPLMVAAIREGRDLYCEFGSRYFERPITKADKAERQFSKCAILGLGYGMGAAKFTKTASLQTGRDITQEEAERAVSLYRGTYQLVPALWSYLNNLLPMMASGSEGALFSLPCARWDKEGFILPSGLRIRYPNLKQDGKEWTYTAYRAKKKDPEPVKIYGGKMAENLCQGLAGEICKVAIGRQLDEPPCLQVHDELGRIAPADEAEVAKGEMEKAMTEPIDWWPDLKLACEIGIADTWGDAK